ncbi:MULTISPECIES: TetR/AcrR family transcriptional regulator [Halomonadaceae]|uniref:TetR family transcriptional regulator n=1 Tax=Vreelandella halophila TaxID=86177 RepID=A0A9X4YDW3_9GAMM|nr:MULTISPECIES: TetR/AcrR family transcriptional regulator [Halomonas]MYL27919.1 TetR family transcriptional regulator [Halomonas utahensis]MYL75045.1 TetR family transcriptional regulator [Halomonas sp. 22501_18_FS]
MLERRKEFDPNETPTGKYRAGRIRDRNLTNIITAAEEEFVRQGYTGTSIQAVADRAGIPKANVHYYFKRKSYLYIAVIEKQVRLWNDLLDEVRVEDDPATVLDSFIRRKVELSYTHPRASKLFAMEVIQGAPHLRDYMRTQMRQWVRDKVSVMETWMEQGRMDRVDPMYLIFLIWASTQHYADFDIQVLTIMNRAEYEPDMIEGIADFLSQIILRGCGLEPPQHGGPTLSIHQEGSGSHD